MSYLNPELQLNRYKHRIIKKTEIQTLSLEGLTSFSQDANYYESHLTERSFRGTDLNLIILTVMVI